MPRKTQDRIGQIFIKEIEPGKWRASWTCPSTRRHVRRILPATAYRDAKAQAKEINKDVAASRGFGGRLRGSVGYGVSDAVLEAIQHTDASERTRKDYVTRFNPFAEYLRGNAKGVASWAEVTEQVLENYLEHCRRQGRAYDTIRQRLFVLRLTSNYMARTNPGVFRDVALNVKLKRQHRSPAEHEAQESILEPPQISALLRWLKDNQPAVHMWGMLQGLCGLRMYEAGYLRESDIDFHSGTIRISESPAHRPKNSHSYRTIPACRAVMEALRRWIGNMKIRHPEGYLFGSPNGAYQPNYISQLWKAALREARAAGIDLPAQFIARRLRASFVTAMRRAGADLATLQAYVGHAPVTMLSARYDQMDMERLGAIATLAQELFEGSGAFKEAAARQAPKPMQR